MSASCVKENRLDARHGLLAVGIALIAWIGSATPGYGQEPPETSPRWSVFLDAGPHVVVQRSRGSVDTNFDFSRRKANNLTSLNFRFGAGLRGPEFLLPKASVRPVVYGAALLPLNESSTIGASLVEETTPSFEIAQEARFAIEYQTSGLVGLGAEFRIPVLDSEISVTPAIESLHLVTRYFGLGKTSLDPSAPNVPSEFHGVRGKTEITQHFIGPALRVGSPAYRVRNFLVDFFVGASVVFDVAGTRERFTVVAENGDRGTFNFESGGGAAQASLGLRILFLP